MLQAGASGYLIKKCAADELITAVRAVVDGKTYLSPDISDMVVQDYLNTMPDDLSSAFSVLTDREREVLQLVAEGLTTKAIAHDLDVSVKTIETHRQHVMEKLDIHSVAELTKYAVREGLTSIEK
jgi:DNA-binding NarL/FixJ family response regulator